MCAAQRAPRSQQKRVRKLCLAALRRCSQDAAASSCSVCLLLPAAAEPPAPFVLISTMFANKLTSGDEVLVCSSAMHRRHGQTGNLVNWGIIYVLNTFSLFEVYIFWFSVETSYSWTTMKLQVIANKQTRLELNSKALSRKVAFPNVFLFKTALFQV